MRNPFGALRREPDAEEGDEAGSSRDFRFPIGELQGGTREQERAELGTESEAKRARTQTQHFNMQEEFQVFDLSQDDAPNDSDPKVLKKPSMIAGVPSRKLCPEITKGQNANGPSVALLRGSTDKGANERGGSQAGNAVSQERKEEGVAPRLLTPSAKDSGNEAEEGVAPRLWTPSAKDLSNEAEREMVGSDLKSVQVFCRTPAEVYPPPISQSQGTNVDVSFPTLAEIHSRPAQPSNEIEMQEFRGREFEKEAKAKSSSSKEEKSSSSKE